MLVRHFMTRPVFTLAPDVTCEEAVRALRERGIRRAPVVEHGRLVGMVSESRLLSLLPGTVGQAQTRAGEETQHLPVRQAMAKEVIAVAANDPLELAARKMLQKKVGGLPVLDGAELKGIVTESDIFRSLWELLSGGRGARLELQRQAEPDGDGAAEPVDYARLATKHGLVLNTLVRHRPPGEGEMAYLRVAGDGLDAFVEELWKRHVKVISVRR